MNHLKAIAATIAVCILLSGCDTSREKGQGPSVSAGNAVTEDIQKGIEKHIEEQTRLDEGYFKTVFEGKELKLELVRFHTEYLANLGPRRHFACVPGIWMFISAARKELPM